MVSVQIAALVAAIASGGETVLLDFQASWCAPCRTMDSTMAELDHAGYPVRKVDVDRERQLAAQFRVTTIPCFVLLVNGQEVGRLAGAVRRDELIALYQRGGVKPGGRPPAEHGPIARAQSPDPAPGRPAHQQPPGPRAGFASLNDNSPEPRIVPTSAHASGVSNQELVNSSVRLTIADAQGNSYGSGTLIDSRQGEALVLTCGHIFRDSQGKGDILVDLLAPGAPQKIRGRVVAYDLKNDIGLVAIRPGVPVRVAQVAPRGHRANPGDRVVTVGCNNGGPPTALDSRVTSVNKFLGPKNLQVAGVPVQGRSGGGLFAANGQVIGVCNAADPTDNEGLYAALAVIHEELDEIGQSAVFENPQSPQSLGGNQFASGANLPRGAALPGPVADTVDMRGMDIRGADVRGVGPVQTGAAGMSPAERAALAQMHKGDGAEVICVVRSLTNPQARSEVIKLDRASSAFLKQLAADREAQESRHLTSRTVPRAAKPAPRPTH